MEIGWFFLFDVLIEEQTSKLFEHLGVILQAGGNQLNTSGALAEAASCGIELSLIHI